MKKDLNRQPKRRQSDRLQAKVRDEETTELATQRRQSNRLKMAMTRSVETIEEATERRQKDQVSKLKKKIKDTNC